MIGTRKLGIVITSTAIAATALAVGIAVGTAHAQAAESVTITGVTETQIYPSAGELAVNLSVTCPAGSHGNLEAYAEQASIGTGGVAVACTGSAQAFTVSISPVNALWNEPLSYGAGQVSAGATLVWTGSTSWFPTVGTVGTFTTS